METRGPFVKGTYAKKVRKEPMPLSQGVVSDDGRTVIMKDGTPSRFFEPTMNLKVNISRGAIIALGGFVAFFFALSAVMVVLYSLGQLTDFQFHMLTSLSFLTALTLLSFLYYWAYSWKYPVSILPTLRGMHFNHHGQRSHFVPWERFQSVSEVSVGREWRINWTDESRRPQYARVLPHTGISAWEAHQSILWLGQVKDTQHFQALNIAPPGTRVFISDQSLTPDQLRYRELARRYLPDGPSRSVYVTIEDDARLVRQYLEEHQLSKEDLKTISSEVISGELWDLGVDVLQRALELDSNDEEVVYFLGGCLLKSERVEEGLKIVDDFLARHPDSSKCHTARAMLSMEHQQVEEALHHVGRAVESDQNNVEALEMWFGIVSGESGVGQAIAELDYVSEKYPEAWGPLIVLGYRMLAQGNSEEALKRFERAYELERNDDTAYGLSNAFYSQQRVAEAIFLLEEAMKEREVGPGIMVNLAKGYATRGESNKAVQVLDRLGPEIGSIWLAEASALRQLIMSRR